MSARTARTFRQLRSLVRTMLSGAHVLAFLPAFTLAGYWIGGEPALLFMAVVMPAIYLAAGLFSKDTEDLAGIGSHANAPHRAAIITALDDAIPEAAARGQSTAAMAMAIDGFEDATRDLDVEDQNSVIEQVSDRVRSGLRRGDKVAHIGNGRFVIALCSIRRADHALMIDIASRLRDMASEPISVSGLQIHLTLSVGFCLPSRISIASGNALLEAAETALAAAKSHGGGSIRGYDAGLAKLPDADQPAIDDLVSAMQNGEIQPWFQPQVCAKTGRVIGLEALARWNSATRGTVMPADFLPLVEPAGLSRRLGELMLYGALSLLRTLDRAEAEVERVSINLSYCELAAPDLADRIRWDLDRFDLAPERLAIEVLETAIAHDTTAVEKNLRSLSDMGCSIDLDDFGTGNTSIAGIRRFAVSRIKIDRSFITRIDQDRDQKDMVSAIMTMARQLNLGTIAEGVESVSEQAALTDLGCGAIQGFVIARPMPAEDILPWLKSYAHKHGFSSGASNKDVKVPEIARGKTA